MGMIGIPVVMGLLFLIGLYGAGVIYLTNRKQTILGLVLPGFFACIAILNLLKPILVYNPHPTMQEGMLMTFFGALSIIGLILFSVTKYLSKRKANPGIKP